jgi:enamine deaminase RidA (YjgF/YER057c/UK114 family)
MNDIESRLNALGLVIPTPASSVANYVGWTTTGNLIFTAGQLALVNGKLNYPGIVGGDMDVETAKLSARLCAINVIAQFKTACNGDLNRITRIIKVTGFVASAPGFTDQPKVVNGASDLFVEVFGDVGIHARSAVGVVALPLNASVEVEAVAEFR